MSKNSLFKITILKWREKNPKHKDGYKKTLIQNSLIHDAVILSLPLSHRWLWIGLLLICGEHNNDTITMTQRQVNELLTTREGAHNALARLESFQLLRFEEIAPLIKEKKRKEEEVKKDEKPPPISDSLKTNSALAFENRFKFQEWDQFLRKNKLFCYDLNKNLNLLVERFETIDAMREFLNEAHARPNVKTMDSKQLNNYMRSVLRGEIGL